MVELRKRTAPPPAPPPAKKKAPAASKAKPKQAEPAAAAAAAPAPAPAASNGSSSALIVGEQITLEGFGGDIETNDGVKTTLAKLVGESKAGVVLFTYPKASTPGCTTQVCLFRDSYAPLTATGLSIYGLSNDSPKANTTFKTKQNLPYPLLCDPAQTLIRAIGMKKAPSGTTRGVFVVGKDGQVLAAEPGGPAATLEVVKRIVGEMGGEAEKKEVIEKVALPAGDGDVTATTAESDEHKKAAAVAAEVAESAAGIDKSAAVPPPA